jgi:molecular chaperone GrpE
MPDEQDSQKEPLEDVDSLGRSTMPLGGGVEFVEPLNHDEDTEIEQLDEEGEELSPQDKMKRLRDELRQCRTERKEYLDGWQRLKADHVNYKRRQEEERDAFLKFSREGIIAELLPVLESFQMAFSNKEAWEKVDPSWRTGVEYIHAQFLRVLQDNGLSTVSPKIGDPFDPAIMTAIETVETDDPSRYHAVADLVQHGFRLSGKLLKSPKVKVFAARGESIATSGS